MSKTIKKIVVTGGPCAGKSTAMSRIEEELSQLGYKILVVQETATELFSSGVVLGENGLSTIEFQTSILDYQLKKEKIYEDIAKKMPQEKVLIICDRGAMDNKAYCTKEEFETIFANLSLNEIFVRDKYDGVFHLKTAADGAEEFYTLENNITRKETPEEARILDLKTINAWTGHPHLRIVGNETDFYTKINRLITEILKLLGEPVPIEIERKFLIEMPDISLLTKQFNAVKVDIIQTYLKTNVQEEEKRIRQRGSNGDFVYFLTTKKVLNEMSRLEVNKRISLDEYMSLFMSIDTNLKPIKKERHCFVYKNQYFELDVYPFWKDKAILEIELTEENQTFVMPDFIKAIKEVTEDVRYKNHSIAREIPS